MKVLSFVLLVSSLFMSDQLLAQAGMSVSPSKLYYKLAPGTGGTQKIVITNPNDKDLEVGVSLSDWDYDLYGNNQIHEAGTLKNSCANWVQVMPGTYFTLQPGEKRELSVLFNVPADAKTDIPVHTAMLFLTQLNPGDSRDQKGTMIKVTVRMGIKLYHSFSQTEDRSLEVINFTDKVDPAKKNLPGTLELEVENNGKIWLDSKISWELMNMQTGDKQKLADQDSFTLPGDKRIIKQNLPAELKKGRYNATAVINYGNKDQLKVVELEFER